MKWIDVEERTQRAFDALEHHDLHLLMANVSERTICARLAEHLRSVFPEYHVDVEYNRHGMDPKQIAVNPAGENKLVYPDVIVHHRGNDDGNLLVMELKKSTNPQSRDDDRSKLKHCVKKFGYEFALLVDLAVGDDLTVACRPRYLERVHPPNAVAT